MKKELGACGLLIALAVGGPAGPVFAQRSGPTLPARSVLDGVYTTQQALRGGGFAERACSHCHNDSYYRGTLLESWKGAKLKSLYDVIRSTMPEDRPGSLKAQEYADLMAYILELNDLPAGAEELKATDLDILIETGKR